MVHDAGRGALPFVNRECYNYAYAHEKCREDFNIFPRVKAFTKIGTDQE